MHVTAVIDDVPSAAEAEEVVLAAFDDLTGRTVDEYHAAVESITEVAR